MTSPPARPRPLPPETIRAIEARADAVHPDEPVATAGEVLALIGSVRDLDATAVVMGQALGRVRAQGREWIESRDLQTAAAGRILLALVDGRRGACTGLT
ncbi:hypothetical protein [Actinomadura formosensis]|uniref:hypothetical protein n=1 Tax=Actinomadura formosensis TaxID=60706 RepID=UPI000832277C|nr:hypothetical protein [Actinomadura formosensis]